MENEKININVTPDGSGELIIRHGEALPVREQRRINLSCTLMGVHEWIDKRKGMHDIYPSRSMVTYDTTSGKIHYVEDTAIELSHEITGRVTIDPWLELFGINSGRYESPDDLANRIRSLSHCFATRSEVLKLVSALKGFEAKVNQDIQEKRDDRGSVKKLRSQVVESNLPEAFAIFVPIVKGGERMSFSVEIHSNETLYVTLFSYDLTESMSRYKEGSVIEQIDRLRESFPGIPIIEI